MSSSTAPRRFRLDPGLGDILDATLAEVKAREISDATRRVFIAFGWILSAASADPRLTEILPEPGQPGFPAAQRAKVAPHD
jgi:hypothetical protein